MKTYISKLFSFCCSVCIAIFIALCIRQFVFELYEVPTGSMRPHIREKDRMLVSKSTFGFRIPLINKSIMRSEKALKRGGMVIFTTANMNVHDSDIKYFGFLNGKKRFIKRCIGKPGDRLYFYEGKIYGIDKNDQLFEELSDNTLLKSNSIDNVSHIPFILFEGVPTHSQCMYGSSCTEIGLYQTGIKLGRLEIGNSFVKGFFFNGYDWLPESARDIIYDRNAPVAYSDMWGIRHFASCRLLTKRQLQVMNNDSTNYDADIFLEMTHTPILAFNNKNKYSSSLNLKTFSTSIPLSRDNIDTIKNNLTTSRFVVFNGRAIKYSYIQNYPSDVEKDKLAVSLKNIPNGCYEFSQGKAYKIEFGGYQKKLNNMHPLMSLSDVDLMTLFNAGIMFNSTYIPGNSRDSLNTQRYAFFRDEHLYIDNYLLLDRSSGELSNFIASENSKQKYFNNNYIAFNNSNKPPVHDKTDLIEFIKMFGMKIPENYFLALGDNFSLSSDSRDFGFVPVDNLLGSPVLIFWPFGERFGRPNHPIHLSYSTIVLWLFIFLLLGLYILKNKTRSK